MSNFCDQTVIELIGGKGGDGSISFRREKHVPRGGPDGGDGGDGGSIIFTADENINTLTDFNNKKIYAAGNGGNGRGGNCTGKTGETMNLVVPAGTIIIDYENKETLADLKKHGQKFIAVTGGKGGKGNYRFKSSVHQAPQFAESGEDGQKKIIVLELRLVADVGIIGFPSAGKSTLISRISNAKPKIADYPFTTLIPNLGVVDMNKYDKRMKDAFVVADIPGLIEGAHQGKGLGHQFLKHVTRTEILVHLIDPTREDLSDFRTINNELEKFDKRLAAKKQIVAISKSDTQTKEQIEAFSKKLIRKHPFLKGRLHAISSVSGEGIKDLVFELYENVKKSRVVKSAALEADLAIIETGEEKIFRPHLHEKKYKITFRRSKKEAATGKTRKIFDIKGARIEQVVKMTDLDNPEGLERIYHFFNRMGIKRDLIKLGATTGDRIRVAGRTIKMRT